jgi:hypothetical protein
MLQDLSNCEAHRNRVTPATLAGYVEPVNPKVGAVRLSTIPHGS